LEESENNVPHRARKQKQWSELTKKREKKREGKICIQFSMLTELGKELGTQKNHYGL
jgi:hypothetical protein